MDVELVARLRAVIGRLARQLNETSTGEGLTPTQYSVLAPVRTRGPLGLTELTELEGLNPTMLSRVIRVLDDAGLIVRSPDPSDMRAARLEITPAGEQRQERGREGRPGRGPCRGRRATHPSRGGGPRGRPPARRGRRRCSRAAARRRR